MHMSSEMLLRGVAWCRGRQVTLRFSCVTVRGEGKGIWKGQRVATAKSLSDTYCVTENIFSSFNFERVGGVLMHWMYTVVYFVNYKTLALQADALIRMLYFCSLNILTSYLAKHTKAGLSLRTCYRFTISPSLPLCICGGRPDWVMLRPL